MCFFVYFKRSIRHKTFSKYLVFLVPLFIVKKALTLVLYYTLIFNIHVFKCNNLK